MIFSRRKRIPGLPRYFLPIFTGVLFFVPFLAGLVLYEFRFGFELIETPPPPAEELLAHLPDRGTLVPCIAYSSTQEPNWGEQIECPANHAFYISSDVAGPNKSGPANRVPLIGVCCRLPFDDILLDEHYENVIERCPDNSVATRGSGPCTAGCSMRCTKINTEKYRLGEETQSYYWIRRGAGRKFGRGSAVKIYHEHIPVALRYAAGRREHNKWANDGCINRPFGALTVRKSGKRCDGLYARRLEYLDGTPVKMFPTCSKLNNIHDPEPVCVK